MINDLMKLNVVINYSDTENKFSGSILLDAEDWATILDAINRAGYRIENHRENKNITLEVQNGKIGTR